MQDLDTDTLDAMGRIAVELPQSSINYPDSLGFAAKEHAEKYGVSVTAKMLPLLLATEKAVGRRFNWFLSANVYIARAYTDDIIVVNPDDVGAGRVDSQLFILFHESGHHIHKHLSALRERGSLVDPEFNRELEFEADTFAVRTMLQEGFRSHEVMLAALAALKQNNPGDASHPSDDDRIHAIRESLRSLQITSP